jgi:RHS repeat-associated protein
MPSTINGTWFMYDGLGERLRKVTGSSTSIYPLGDDYEITNGVVTKYISVDGLGVIAKRVGTSPNITTYWLHTDRLGSIQAVTDLSGNELQRRTYLPYGDKIADTTAHTESRGWIDQRTDGETRLTYLHARYYDPELGLFLSPDPLHPTRPGVGLNRYSYVNGNPVNGTDRSGLAWWCRTVSRGRADGGRGEEIDVICTWIPDSSGGSGGGGGGGGGGKRPGGGGGTDPGGDECPGGRAGPGCEDDPKNPGPEGPDGPGNPDDPAPPPKPPNDGCQVSATPTGAVIQAGVEGETGLVAAGMMGQGAVGIAIVRGIATFASGGANAGLIAGLGWTAPRPANAKDFRGFALGASVGGGLQIGITNAPGVNALQGPFMTVGLNTPWGSGQYSFTNSSGGSLIYVASLGGPALGFSVSAYKTNTGVLPVVEGKCK